MEKVGREEREERKERGGRGKRRKGRGLSAYRLNGECTDAVLSNVLHFLEAHFQVAIGGGPIGWPVLVALHLHTYVRVRKHM